MWDNEGLTAKAQRYLIASCVVFLIVIGALTMCGCGGDSDGTGGIFPEDPPVIDDEANDEVLVPFGRPKVTICHQGDFGPETLSVADRSVNDHLAHGDFVGACPTGGANPPEEDHVTHGDQDFEQVS